MRQKKLAMGKTESAFEKLAGRRPTQASLQRLYQVRDELGLKDDDALWFLLVALEHYQSLYEDMPKTIRAETEKIFASTRSTAEAVANEAIHKAHFEIATSIANTAKQVAKDTASRDRARSWRTTAITFCVTLVVSISALVLYWNHAYDQGRDDMRKRDTFIGRLSDLNALEEKPTNKVSDKRCALSCLTLFLLGRAPPRANAVFSRLLGQRNAGGPTEQLCRILQYSECAPQDLV